MDSAVWKINRTEDRHAQTRAFLLTAATKLVVRSAGSITSPLTSLPELASAQCAEAVQICLPMMSCLAANGARFIYVVPPQYIMSLLVNWEETFGKKFAPDKLNTREDGALPKPFTETALFYGEKPLDYSNTDAAVLAQVFHSFLTSVVKYWECIANTGGVGFTNNGCSIWM